MRFTVVLYKGVHYYEPTGDVSKEKLTVPRNDLYNVDSMAVSE